MGLGYKGKSIGEVLNFVLNAVIDDKVDNNKDELIKVPKELQHKSFYLDLPFSFFP